ncbi:hypothetical protein H0184_04365, partial [Neobacillus niacini]|nr:hypothetical protein [Neobacillus niacini]
MKIPYSDKGNGVFVIEGRTVQAVAISGDWYIKWSLLSPKKITAVKIPGGYNFNYSNPVKIQLNGIDFAYGGHALDGATY